MTDIRETESQLVLPEDLYGKIFIHTDTNFLIVELNKSQGRQIEIGLNPVITGFLLIRDVPIIKLK